MTVATKTKAMQANREGSPSQIELISALTKCLYRQGYPDANERQLNAVIEAANVVVAAFGDPHRPATTGSGLVAWMLSDETGSSSRAMARKLGPLIGHGGPFRGGFAERRTDHPYDPSDLGRCIGLLDAVPELRPHLPAMADVSPQWARLVAAWDELEALYWIESPAGRAPKCYARMKKVLEAKDA